MALDEELLDQMNRLEMAAEEANRKAAWEKEAVEGVQAGTLCVNGTKIAFHRESLFDDKVSIMIPNIFAVMDPELAAIKYPSVHRPDPIFSNASGSITIGFNHTGSKVKKEEIDTFKAHLIRDLQRMQPAASVLEDGVKTVQGQPVGYFEFLAPALDSDLYNLLFFTELEGRALLGSFNCLEKDLEQWQPIAKGMMESLCIEANDAI